MWHLMRFLRTQIHTLQMLDQCCSAAAMQHYIVLSECVNKNEVSAVQIITAKMHVCHSNTGRLRQGQELGNPRRFSDGCRADRDSRERSDLANCLECVVIDIAAALQAQACQIAQPNQLFQAFATDLQHVFAECRATLHMASNMLRLLLWQHNTQN